jgi:hypothetical protein
LDSVSALLQLASNSLPFADNMSVKQHQVGQTEQIESELSSEAEEAETKEAEILLQECSICLDNKQSTVLLTIREPATKSQVLAPNVFSSGLRNDWRETAGRI